MGDGVLGSGAVGRVARGGITAFVVYGAGVGLTFCAQLLIARIVGVDTYGIYAYVIAWVTVLAYFSALGFDVALLRFVPAYEARRAWPLFRGVIQYAERRVTIVGLSVIVIGVCVVMSKGLLPQVRNTFYIGFMLVPILALLWIRCSVVRAFGGVALAVAPDRVVRDGMLVSLVAIASLGFGLNFDSSMVMTATLVSSLAGLVLVSFAMRSLRPRFVDDIAPEYEALTWRRAALPLVIIGATEALMNRTGVILLGWMGDTKEAGIYSLAFNIAFVVALPRIAVNTLFAPTISGLFVRKDQATLQVLVTTAAAWTLAAAACIALVLFILAEPLLSWFGPGYETGVPALRILLIGQVIAASAGSQLYVMTMTGHERGAAVLLISSAVANAVASAVLIGLFQLTGAAVATTATLVVWNVAMGLSLWFDLHLLPGVLAMFRAPLAKKASVENRTRGGECSTYTDRRPNLAAAIRHHDEMKAIALDNIGSNEAQLSGDARVE
jgi:O-antigen/teichoic acid export membrane protein